MGERRRPAQPEDFLGRLEQRKIIGFFCLLPPFLFNSEHHPGRLRADVGTGGWYKGGEAAARSDPWQQEDTRLPGAAAFCVYEVLG
jgi:hypothetical protein